MTLNKRAQHEMVGFVLIVIIVTIIGLIFLTLFLAKKDTRPTAEVSNLLQAIMYYTSNCYSQNNEPQEVEELINICYRTENKKCLDGTKVCDALDAALIKSLDEGLRVGEESKNKAYYLQVYFRGVLSRDSLKNITSLTKGSFMNCSSVEGGTHTITIGSSGGIISVDLLLCKSMGSSDLVKEATSNNLGVRE